MKIPACCPDKKEAVLGSSDSVANNSMRVSELRKQLGEEKGLNIDESFQMQLVNRLTSA